MLILLMSAANIPNKHSKVVAPFGAEYLHLSCKPGISSSWSTHSLHMARCRPAQA